jgi:hypothetical protein
LYDFSIPRSKNILQEIKSPMSQTRLIRLFLHPQNHQDLLAMSDNKVTVQIKKKQIQSLIDYCLENKLEFGVSPKNSEEWNYDITLDSISKAILFGMYLRDNKIDYAGYAAAVKEKKQQVQPDKKEGNKPAESPVIDLSKEPNLLDFN